MRWRASVDRAVAPHGLTDASYSVLASLFSRLESGSAPSQRELAEVTGLEPAYMSKLVRILERDGYVRRAEHPDDTRSVQLTLTRAGRRTVEAAIATVQALHDELLAPLGGPRSARPALQGRAPDPAPRHPRTSEARHDHHRTTAQRPGHQPGGPRHPAAARVTTRRSRPDVRAVDRDRPGGTGQLTEEVAVRARLSEALGLDAPTIDDLLDGLVATGLLERQKGALVLTTDGTTQLGRPARRSCPSSPVGSTATSTPPSWSTARRCSWRSPSAPRPGCEADAGRAAGRAVRPTPSARCGDAGERRWALLEERPHALAEVGPAEALDISWRDSTSAGPRPVCSCSYTCRFMMAMEVGEHRCASSRT